MKKLATFDYVVGVFPSQKFKLISENFETGQPKKLRPFFLSVMIGKGIGGVTAESEG